MTAFEVPIYPEESPDIGIPVQYPPELAANALYGKRDQAVPTYHCDRGSECTRTLTCQGLHTEVTICTGIETCKDSSHE